MNITYKKITKQFLLEHMDDFLEIIKDWKYCTWRTENFLYELDKKWELSFALYGERGDLSGFCIASEKEKKYYIHLLFISEKNRGKNLGKEILTFATEEAKKHHYTTIWLRCPQSNSGAYNFYIKNKFKVVEIVNDNVSGNEADYILQLSF